MHQHQHWSETTISPQRGLASFAEDISWRTNEAVQQNEVLELERSLRDPENELTEQRIQSDRI